MPVAGSPNASFAILEDLRADRDAPRSPADGGGRAWLEPDEDGALPSPVARGTGRFRLVYEAGPLGIAPGGMIFLQVSPFWGWSTPQTRAPDLPGYTELSTDAAGVELVAETLDRQLLGVRIEGRALASGERVELIYGAGVAGATVDQFADARSYFFFGVDGDGDGVRALLPESPYVVVRAGPPARLVLHVPSVVRPGEPVVVHAALLDATSSSGVDAVGTVEVQGLPEPLAIELAPGAGGRGSATVDAPGVGLWRLRGRGPGGLEAEANPLLVSPTHPRIRWADLHGHSSLSDGTGSPQDWYRYARDVAGLDAAALTDHDHWGLPFLARTPANWQEIREAARVFNAPGSFVTLLGYEWTSWVYGHRHVLHFDAGEDASVIDSVDEATDTPAELWRALEGQRVLTFAHHSAGSPVATDWSFAPDPLFEPVTEVVSVHGNSESAEAPWPIRGAIPGNWVPDALARGYRLGFIGSGDGHDGHPGLTHLESGTGGLAAIASEDLTREGLLEALRARRTYATSGQRILLDVRAGGAPMGATLEAGREVELRASIVGTAPLAAVEVVINGETVERLTPGGDPSLEPETSFDFERTVPALESGSFLYLRVVQQDQGTAWSSPFFFR